MAMSKEEAEAKAREYYGEEGAACVVCQAQPVQHAHVVCRLCNEREHHNMLSPEEKERLEAEIQHRSDNP